MTKVTYCSKELCKMLEKAGINAHHVIHFEEGGSWYKIYTLDIVQKWLREEKYILIFIVPAKDDSGNLMYTADVWTWNEDEGLYKTTWCISDYVYEKALEAAIIHCVNNLIKEE